VCSFAQLPLGLSDRNCKSKRHGFAVDFQIYIRYYLQYITISMKPMKFCSKLLSVSEQKQNDLAEIAACLMFFKTPDFLMEWLLSSVFNESVNTIGNNFKGIFCLKNLLKN